MSREEKSNKIIQEWEKEEKRKNTYRRIWKLAIVFLLLTVFIVGMFCYMRFIGTSGLIVREYKIVDSMLPSSFHGFKVVHFSDLHYQSTIDYSGLKDMIKEINLLKPDIVVFTGDLTDQDCIITDDDVKDLVTELKKIEATTGMYAIRGNRDYATDIFNLVFQETDFKILDNKYELIYYHGMTPILITGVGSNIQNDFNMDSAYSYSKSGNIFTISLLHEPDLIDSILSRYSVNLALAGHSHNGQISIPEVGAIFKVDGAKKYPNSQYTIGNTKMFISGGLGTSTYKLRFFNRPSINLYRLVEE